MVHVSPCTWGLLFCSLFRIVRTVHPSATEPSGKSHLLLCDVLSAHQINPHGFSLSPHWSNLFSLLLTYYAVYDFPSFVACTWMKSPCQSFCTLCPLNHCSHLIYHFTVDQNNPETIWIRNRTCDFTGLLGSSLFHDLCVCLWMHRATSCRAATNDWFH